MGVKISRFENEFRLEAELLLPRKIEDVFSFFAEARNLEELTPPMLRFQIMSQAEIEMSSGATIDYRLRIHGVPVRWTSLISEWDPPNLFVDEQIRGPYRYWIHQHIFEEHESGTVVKDFVRYQVFGGQLVHKLFVKRDLVKIFSFRQEQLLRRFS